MSNNNSVSSRNSPLASYNPIQIQNVNEPNTTTSAREPNPNPNTSNKVPNNKPNTSPKAKRARRTKQTKANNNSTVYKKALLNAWVLYRNDIAALYLQYRILAMQKAEDLPDQQKKGKVTTMLIQPEELIENLKKISFEQDLKEQRNERRFLPKREGNKLYELVFKKRLSAIHNTQAKKKEAEETSKGRQEKVDEKAQKGLELLQQYAKGNNLAFASACGVTAKEIAKGHAKGNATKGNATKANAKSSFAYGIGVYFPLKVAAKVTPKKSKANTDNATRNANRAEKEGIQQFHHWYAHPKGWRTTSQQNSKMSPAEIKEQFEEKAPRRVEDFDDTDAGIETLRAEIDKLVDLIHKFVAAETTGDKYIGARITLRHILGHIKYRLECEKGLKKKQHTMEASKRRKNNQAAEQDRKKPKREETTKGRSRPNKEKTNNEAARQAAQARKELINQARKRVEELNVQKIITLAKAYNIDQQMDLLKQERTRLLNVVHKNQVKQRKVAAKLVPELGKDNWSYFLKQGAGNPMLMKVAAAVRARAKQPPSSKNNRIPEKLLNNLRTHIGNKTLPEMNADGLSDSLNIFKFLRNSAVAGKPLHNEYQQQPWYKGENKRGKSRGTANNSNNKGTNNNKNKKNSNNTTSNGNNNQ